MKIGFIEEFIKIVQPGKTYDVLGINFETVLAYNIDKQYHPKENNWVGYIFFSSYYISIMNWNCNLWFYCIYK